MELSAVTVRVVLLFFPGVVCALLVEALTPRRNRSGPEFLTNAFVLGLGSYLLLAAARALCAAAANGLGLTPPPPVTFFDVLADEKLRISWAEIALSACMAIVLAAVFAATHNTHLLYKGAQRVGISRNFGEADVWAFFLNAPEVEWVTVRDLDTDLMYEGWVEAYSDTGDNPALLLREVQVSRNASGVKLYESERVYLSQARGSIVVEQLS